MPEDSPVPLRHLDFSNRANRQDYTARPTGGGSTFSLYPQQRAAHAKKLEQELQVVERESERLRLVEELAPLVEDVGVNIVVRSEPGYELRTDVLDAPKFGVTLKNVRMIQVHRPDGSIALLNFVSELRRPAVTAAFFIQQRPSEQRQWVDELLNRTALPLPDAPAVCVLDTGVNRGHPLIESLLAEQALDSLRPDWGKDDHEGHGTGMAGLAAYGDLTALFDSTDKIQLTHWLESVKVLPRTGHNEPEHYGALTQEAMARAELNAPERGRVYALAVTATDAKDFHENGKPSAWSAALDSYAAGYLDEDEVKRLTCVSAGNVRLSKSSDYPSLNDLSSIEDPAQSWNSVTVGAFTEKDVVTDADGRLLEEWNSTAKRGGLCPASTTSVLWKGSRNWPIKPEIVVEGGNCAADHTDFPTWLDSLALLTTNAEMQRGLLATFQATSAATALAAKLAATVQAEYPEYWPETIRALMAHAADWTEEMKRGHNLRNKGHIADIMHRFGYGVPSLEKCRHCARSRATLICQDSLQPFDKVKTESTDGSVTHRLKTKDMMLYILPWPKALLTENPDTLMRLRVTLSYFVEPNPGSRPVNNKYRYANCNLRFKVQTPTENSKGFVARVSAAVSDEEREACTRPDDTTKGWWIGEELSCRGSLHCDTWEGTAADLAQMEHLLVYPANGWWRLRPYLNQFTRRIRYSLVVSIESRGLDIDLYAPISTTIAQTVPLEVGI